MVEKRMFRYNTNDRVEYIYNALNHLGLSKKIIKQVLEADAECIRSILMDCNDVKITNVGTLRMAYVKPRPPREGRNVRTSEVVQVPEIPEYNKVVFMPEGSFKDELKEKTLGDAIMPDRKRARVEGDGEEINA